MVELVNANFSYSFDDLIPLTNRLASEYKEETDEIKRQFILCDLIMYLEQLTFNYCKKFKTMVNAFEMDLDDAAADCLGVSLFATLNAYDPAKGSFLSLYYKVIENDLKSHFRSITTKTEKFHRNNLSGDACYSNDGVGTLFDTLTNSEDVAEKICRRVILEELIVEFEKTDIYGRLIRIEMYGSATDKTNERLRVLGAAEYGDAERQLVQRTKRRFKRFLVANNFDLNNFKSY